MSEPYKPAGKIGSLFVPMVLGGMLLAAVVGFAYQYLVDWIPFIYVSVLLTVGLALGLGLLLRAMIKKGKCRNLIVAGLAGVLLAAAAHAGSFYSALRLGRAELAEELQRQVDAQEIELNEGLTAETAAAEIFTFEGWVENRIETGWTIGSSSGLELTGIMVWLVWLIEAGILVVGAVLGARTAADDPYCESCDDWTDQHEVGVIDKLTRSSVDSVRGASDIAPFLALSSSEAGDHALAFTVHVCPGCKDTRFVGVKHHWAEKKGKEVSLKDEKLLKAIRMSTEHAEALRDRFTAPPKADPASEPDQA